MAGIYYFLMGIPAGMAISAVIVIITVCYSFEYRRRNRRKEKLMRWGYKVVQRD